MGPSARCAVSLASVDGLQSFRLPWERPNPVVVGRASPLAGDDPVTVRVSRATTRSASGGGRIVHLKPEYGDLLRAHWASSDRPAIGTPVFTAPRAGPLAQDGVVRSTLKRLHKATGLEHVTRYTLRHSHASWSAGAGVHAPELAARMGHGDAVFSQRRYMHALESERHAEVTKLAEYRARTRTKSGS
jgi:integrase